MVEATPTTEPTKRVLLDANQWRAQFGLRSRLGAALLFLVRQHRALLVLPEVVESEIDRLLVAEGRKAVQQINDALRVLQTVTGSHPSVTLPTTEGLAESVADRLRELHPLLLRIPISVDHARRALARVNARQSPNRKREQFKDSLIWEAAWSAAASGDLYLVTDDAAFYASDGKSMADDLAQECLRAGLSITLVRDVRQLLEILRTTAPALDYELIARQTYELLADYLVETVGRDHLTLGALDPWIVQALATEDHRRVVTTFELEGTLHGDVVQVDSPAGRFLVHGEGAFDLDAMEVVDAKPGRCQVTSISADGEERVSQNILLGTATAYIGREPPKRLTIREPLG